MDKEEDLHEVFGSSFDQMRKQTGVKEDNIGVMR
jgi:hypothetical protein